jgi:parvulin-like peptidyl-prolyl isomerase
MGLDKDDTVTRRRMAQRLEFLTSDLVRLAEPAEGELEQYLQDNIAQFQSPDQITFIQVFFNPDQRDETTLDDAARVLAQLQAAGVPDPVRLEAGDSLMLQSYYQSVSELEVRKQLGGGFASAVMELEPGTWHGPVLSGYGVHLVYVFERLEAPPPDFTEVRPLVLQAWQAEQIRSFNEKFYDGLKSRYEIVIENPELGPDGILLRGQGIAADGATDAEPES